MTNPTHGGQDKAGVAESPGKTKTTGCCSAVREGKRIKSQAADQAAITSPATHAYLSASAIRSLAARNAGNNPPTRPITRAKTKDSITMAGVNVKSNDNSAKVCQFMVETLTVCIKEASKIPSVPPTRPRRHDSVINADKISRRRNPKARRVAISDVRSATELYMVIIAPSTAPIANLMLSVVPKILKKFDITFRLGFERQARVLIDP